MPVLQKITLLSLAASLASTLSIIAPPAARAQDAASMSCEQLWYARNQIYARNGYCFNTDRAREVFGPGCFPPFGRLGGWEKARVEELQMWERRNGC